MAIVLSPPRLGGTRVTVDIDPGEASAYLRSGPLWAEYDVDLAGVDPSLLLLPALGAVLPVAYAAGVPIEVDTVDRDFACAADELAPVWSAMHAGFAPADRFRLTGERVRPDRGSTSGSHGQTSADGLLLFSGGLDCSTSLVANSDRIGSLLSVWGVDVPLADGGRWQVLTAAIAASPLTAGRRLVQVRTNCRDVVRGARLGHDFLQDRQWWAHAHHGMQLLTLAAPVAAALGIRTVYIAASLTATSLEPWGSTPATDEPVRWTGTRVVHDCFGLDRQQKTRLLAESGVLAAGHRLAVCFQPTGRPARLNCGRCEKCLRTATGLMVAGVDPGDAGLHITADRFAALQAEPAGRRTMTANLASWRAVQSAIPDDLGGTRAAGSEYLAWLRTVDLSLPASTQVPAIGWMRELRYRIRLFVDVLPRPVRRWVRVSRSAWWHRPRIGAGRPPASTGPAAPAGPGDQIDHQQQAERPQAGHPETGPIPAEVPCHPGGPAVDEPSQHGAEDPGHHVGQTAAPAVPQHQ